jgi:hypothetical protein
VEKRRRGRSGSGGHAGLPPPSLGVVAVSGRGREARRLAGECALPLSKGGGGGTYVGPEVGTLCG